MTGRSTNTDRTVWQRIPEENADPLSKHRTAGSDYTAVIHHDTYDFINPRQFDLANRKVFISGASKGLGLAAAVSFAAAGCSNFALAARSSLDAAEAAIVAAAKAADRPAPTVLKGSVDVTDQQSVQSFAQKVKEEFGGLDIVVNNAGSLGDWKFIREANAKDWWHTWEVNVLGAFLVTQAFLPLLTDQEGSLQTLVNITSVAAQSVLPGGSDYSVSKFALLRLTEVTNLEEGDSGILAFAFHPGGVQTELSSGLPDALQSIVVDMPALGADSLVWLTAQRREWLRSRYISANWDLEEVQAREDVIVAQNQLRVRLRVGGPPASL